MYLFESFIGRVEWIRRYKAGPLLEERDAFLRHLQDEGHSVRMLREYNKYLLPITEMIDLGQKPQVSDGRQLEVPIMLPHSEMLPKNFARFCPESEVDDHKNLSTVMIILQDTGPSW
jgi:hypothetical protein